MEVHHPHHPTHKKHWNEYLLEFFMLFLAVTLGFIAENIREGVVEKEKGEKYLHQLLADLRQDTAKIGFCNAFKLIKEQQADSLIALLHAPDINNHTATIYYYSRIMPVREPFYGTDGTLKQLQNAGGFRMIGNEGIVRSINTYTAAREKIYQIQDMQDFSSLQMRGASGKIFDSRIENAMLDVHNNKGYRYYIKPIATNAPLASYDKTLINEYCNWVVWMMTAEKYDYALLERLRSSAIKLMAEIEMELGEGDAH